MAPKKKKKVAFIPKPQNLPKTIKILDPTKDFTTTATDGSPVFATSNIADQDSLNVKVKTELDINNPYKDSHHPVNLSEKKKSVDYTHLIEQSQVDHKEAVAGFSTHREAKDDLWQHMKRLQGKYKGVKGFEALASLKEEHISDDPTERLTALMQHLQEEHAHSTSQLKGMASDDQEKPEALEKQAAIGNQLNMLYTGMYQFLEKRRKQYPHLKKQRTGQYGIVSRLQDGPGDIGSPPNEVASPGDDTPDTEAIKNLLTMLPAAFNPELIAAYHSLRNNIYANKVTARDDVGKAHETKIYNAKHMDLLGVEARIAKLNINSAVGYGANFATNLDFLSWYTRDGSKHDINLVHLINTHPELSLMAGFFGNIVDKGGKKKLALDPVKDAFLQDRLMIFKLLLGPTSANLTPIQNSETALKIFQDGYFELVKAAHNRGERLDPSDISMVSILRHASLQKTNSGELQILEGISKRNHGAFYTKKGEPLPSGDYKGGINVYTKEGEPLYKKWLNRPKSTEDFLQFVKDSPEDIKTDKDMIEFYFRKRHAMTGPGAESTPKNILDKVFWNTHFEKNGELTLTAANTLRGVFSLGAKFGPYVLSMLANSLHHIDGELTAPFVGDRVMTEYFSRWMNTVFGGAPENDAQRAGYAHAMNQTCFDLGYKEKRKNRDKSLGDIPRVDMLQGFLWANQQGSVRALGGTNPSSYLSHGVISFGKRAQILAVKKAAALRVSRDPDDRDRADALEKWAKDFKHISQEDMYVSPKEKKQEQDAISSAKNWGGGAYKIDAETLQKLLRSFQLKGNTSSNLPPGNVSKAPNAVKRKAVVLKRTGSPVRFAQFTTPAGVSPGVSHKTNLPFGNAVARAGSGKNIAQAQLGDQLGSKAGVRTKSSTAVGDWPDGSEQSTVHYAPIGTEETTLDYLGAWHGLAGKKKSVLVFHPSPDGPDSMYHLEHPETDLEKIRMGLSHSGIHYKTLVPGDNGTKVLIFDPNRGLQRNIDVYATKNNLNVEENTGQGKIIGHNGSWNSAGALAKARQAFRNIIDAHEQKGTEAGYSPNTGGAPSGQSASPGEATQHFRKTGKRFKLDKTRRILEGFLRQYNSPHKELPPTHDLLSQDIQDLREDRLDKYQNLIPGVQWEDLQDAVGNLQHDPEKFADMTSETSRRESYCKEHARSVLRSSGLSKMLDSLLVNHNIPEHAQYLVDDAKDGDYFALEALSAELQHSVPSLKAMAKSAEREYTKAGRTWDKMRGGPQKYTKKHHSASQARGGPHGTIYRGAVYGAGMFSPSGPGKKYFENSVQYSKTEKAGNNITNSIKHLRGT